MNGAWMGDSRHGLEAEVSVTVCGVQCGTTAWVRNLKCLYDGQRRTHEMALALPFMFQGGAPVRQTKTRHCLRVDQHEGRDA